MEGVPQQQQLLLGEQQSNAIEPSTIESSNRKTVKKQSNTKQSLKNAGKTVFHALKWILLVVVGFLLFALIASWNSKRTQTYSKQELQSIKSLVVIAAKSAEEAEKIGSSDPLQALLHANYAVCYINAAKHMVNSETIESLVGSDIHRLETYLSGLQASLIDQVESRNYPKRLAASPVATQNGLATQKLSNSAPSTVKNLSINQAVAAQHKTPFSYPPPPTQDSK